MGDLISVQKMDFVESATIGAGLTVNLITLNIPAGLLFEIDKIANYVNDVNAWGFMTWTLKHNGVLIPYINTIKDQYGFSGEPRKVNHDWLYSAGKFTVDVTNSSGVDYQAGFILQGNLGYKNGN